MPRTLASSKCRRREARSDPLAVDAVIDNNRPEQRSVRVDLQRRAPYHAAVGACYDRGVEMVEQAIDRQLLLRTAAAESVARPRLSPVRCSHESLMVS